MNVIENDVSNGDGTDVGTLSQFGEIIDKEIREWNTEVGGITMASIANVRTICAIILWAGIDFFPKLRKYLKKWV